MKTTLSITSLITVVLTILFAFPLCDKKNSAPKLYYTLSSSVGSTFTEFHIDLNESRDDEDNANELQFRIDWEDDGVWERDWTFETNHLNTYESEGNYSMRVEIKDTDGKTTSATETLTVTNSHNLIPAHSPFGYNVGINYETRTVGRNNRNIVDDLDLITKHFKLIKTFHAAAVGTSTPSIPIIDPDLKIVIDYMVAHKDEQLELAMGTNNNVLGIFPAAGEQWAPGLMTNKSYTDKFVQLIISSFGSKENVIDIVKTIMLGNEIDGNKPAPTDPHYHDFYANWVPQSFENLKESMHEAGLGNIPITTIIANYPQGKPVLNDSVQTSVTRYITNNWSSTWNSGNPFLMFNMYTEGKSTDFGFVIKYFTALDNIFNDSSGVYVGETGYTAEYGAENQVKVVKQIFSWLEGQYQHNKITIPLFVFMAFDRPDKAKYQKKMGIFSDDSNNKPIGLKTNIEVPTWVGEKKK